MKNCCESVWRNNAQLVRLLGICPLLAVSDRLVTGLAIGLAYLAAFIWTHLIVALTRAVFPPALRGLYVAIVTACGVTLLQLTIAAYRPALAAALGVYLPVIAACCLLQSDGMGTRKGSPRDLIREGIQRGGGGLVVVGILSAIREVIGFRIPGSESRHPTWSGFRTVGLAAGLGCAGGDHACGCVDGLWRIAGAAPSGDASVTLNVLSGE